MEKSFQREADRLVSRGWILFHGYKVILCPYVRPAPFITVNRAWNCYCINLPGVRREEWPERAAAGLESIYKGVICRDDTTCH